MKEHRYSIYEEIAKGTISYSEADEKLKELFSRSEKIPIDIQEKAIEEAKMYWAKGKKKKAIKIVKLATGLGLKQCKEYCEENFSN